MFPDESSATPPRGLAPSGTSPNRYSNYVAEHLIGLLSIARLPDDGQKFKAVLYGDDHSIPLAIPWIEYFDHAIYGGGDKRIACYKNSSPDSITSDSSYQTEVVAQERLRIVIGTMGTCKPLATRKEC